MDAVALQRAYDSACAVFSERFRFVESRLYAVDDKGASRPFNLTQERKDWVRPIKGEKWIYVFRRMPGAATSKWVEEVRVATDGELFATPMEKARGKPDARPKGVPIGKTMRLPRRIQGYAFAHHFYASRLRLALSVIERLEREVHLHTPAVTFEPDPLDVNLLRDGKDLLVPVLDPLSVARNLHACFIAAADDLTSYTTPVKDAPDTDKVKRRAQKQLLASMLQAVARGGGGGNVLRELEAFDVLDRLVADYGRQVTFRKNRVERLGTYLARWLDGVPMKWAADGYRAAARERFSEYLVVFCIALHRLAQAEEGRKLLQRLVEDQDHFVHTYVIPTDKPADDVVQAIRKSGMAVLTGWAALSPFWVRGMKKAEYVRLSLEYVLEHPVTIQKRVVRFHHDGSLVVQVEITKELEPKYSVFKARQVSHPELVLFGRPPEKVEYKGAIKSVAALVELANLAFAVDAAADAFSGDSAGARVVAVTNLVGAMLDAGTAIGEVFEVGAKKLALMGTLSGLIDTVLAIRDAARAASVGDTGGLVGSLVVAGGSYGGVVGTLLGLAGATGATPVAVISLAIVAIGYLIKIAFAKTDMEILFAHCTWGNPNKRGTGGNVDWSPVPLAMLETDYDAQIRALVNLLCALKVTADPPRAAKIELGWLPGRATLVLTYDETWRTLNDTRNYVQTVRFTGGEANLPDTGGPLSVVNLGGTLFVQPSPGTVTQRAPGHTRRYRHGDEFEPDPDFVRIRLSAQLHIDFGSGQKLLVPHDKPVTTDLASY
jgi:hypothetical protein